MIFYAVVDTNVLVSALLTSHSDAATVQVVDRLFDGAFIPLFSEEILAEYNEVLRRDKFHFSEPEVGTLISSIENSGTCIHPAATNEVLPDMKDLPFYEVVMDRQSDDAFLVTGNLKHFPKKPFIVTAREFLDIINQSDK